MGIGKLSAKKLVLHRLDAEVYRKVTNSEKLGDFQAVTMQTVGFVPMFFDLRVSEYGECPGTAVTTSPYAE
jgi:hypothetical protein